MTSALREGDRVLTHAIYDPASIAKAVEDYRPHLSVSVLGQSATNTVVSFAGPDGGEASEEVVREFLNYALDLSVRRILGAA